MKKIALISGASSGIGLACVQLFAKHGCHVICLGRDLNRLNSAVRIAKKAGASGAQAFVLNFEKRGAIEKFCQRVLFKIDCLDYLVNAAGIAQTGSVENISDNVWEKIFRINVTSSFALIRGCIPYLEQSKSPAVVNVSSIAGRLRSISLGAHYSASKAAVIGMTRHLAAELGPRGIRVNVVCPGQTYTPMLEAALNKESQQRLANSIPLRRLARPKEQAEVIYFLCSPASSYINGAVIDVNGGAL